MFFVPTSRHIHTGISPQSCPYISVKLANSPARVDFCDDWDAVWHSVRRVEESLQEVVVRDQHNELLGALAEPLQELPRGHRTGLFLYACIQSE